MGFVLNCAEQLLIMQNKLVNLRGCETIKVKMLRFLKSILLINLLLLTGCFQLPEYAQPHIMETEKKQGGFEGGITYRKLTVDDFQALKLPEDMAPHEKSIGAHVCSRIRVGKDSRFSITRGYINQYYGTIKHIVFEAVMNPECSWLNPDISGEKLGYVLEHEQIHFALMEIAAIKLTQDVRKEAKNFIAVQSTRQDTKNEIFAKIREMVLTANQAVLKEHKSFDDYTSLYFDPKAQRWWLYRVEDQLLKQGGK